MASFTGGAGADTLTGTAERDYIAAGGGNDTIDSGAGNDWIEGGTGADTFVFNPGCGWDCVGDFHVAEGDRLDLRGWSAIRSTANLTIQADGNDTVILFGTSDGVRLMGVAASSLTAAQFLFAGGTTGGPTTPSTPSTPPPSPGGRTLTGTGARDYLIGGAGNDTIIAGGGYDYLEGGAGQDTFVCAPGDSWDYIQDFQAGGGGDVLDLSAWGNIRSRADLTISSDANGTSLVFGPNDGMRLNGVLAGALTAANFRFAEQAPQAPVAQAQTLSTDEDKAVSGRLGASDPDTPPEGLSYALAENGGPRHGTVAVNADGTFAYTPGKDYYGSDAFTFRVTDGSGLTSIATVEVDVRQMLDDPYAYILRSGREIYRVALDQPGAAPERMENYLVPNGSYYADIKISGTTLFGRAYDGSVCSIDLAHPEEGRTGLAMRGYLTTSMDGSVYAFNGTHLYGYDPAQPGQAPALMADLSAWTETVRGFAGTTYYVGNDTLFFTRTEQTSSAYMGYETELYRLDLRTPGASPVKTDMFPGTYQSAYYYTLSTLQNSSSPDYFTEAGGNLYFAANRGGSGRELFRIDLDSPWAFPSLVSDLYPGGSTTVYPYYTGRYQTQPSGTYTVTTYNGSHPERLTEAGGDLFFTANTPDRGRELYRLDTDEPGAVPMLVADLMPGSGSSNPTHLFGTDDALYFFAQTPNGMEFLRYDLHTGGAPMSGGIDWGSMSGDPTPYQQSIATVML